LFASTKQSTTLVSTLKWNWNSKTLNRYLTFVFLFFFTSIKCCFWAQSDGPCKLNFTLATYCSADPLNWQNYL
jgi:hypothetical protein